MTGASRTVEVDPEGERFALTPDAIVVAGFTGRDDVSIREHIAELEEQGIPGPPRVPCFFLVSPDNLVVAPATVTVATPETSGEAEAVVIFQDGRAYVGVGSDHTDRALERLDFSGSKRVCPKLVSGRVWRLDDVEARWDDLILRAYACDDDGGEVLVQESPLSALLPPATLFEEMRAQVSTLARNFVLFTGTVPAIARPPAAPTAFRATLGDPVAGRSLECGYAVKTITGHVEVQI